MVCPRQGLWLDLCLWQDRMCEKGRQRQSGYRGSVVIFPGAIHHSLSLNQDWRFQKLRYGVFSLLSLAMVSHFTNKEIEIQIQ